MKLKNLFQVYKNQGPRYFFYRSLYELKRKSGLLKSKFPIEPDTANYPSLKEWKSKNIPFFFSSRDDLTFQRNPSKVLASDYQRILDGEIQFFNHDWKHISDWLTNPDSDFTYNNTDHWTSIEDITKEAGDIKYVWEKSRFSFLYTIIRYDYHFQKDSSAFVLNQIENWIDHNPINKGPNYKCSQEISLRCMKWIFALHFYKNSELLTEKLWQKIIHTIYWQIKHVEENINFSRICVRNNHAITETLMLYIGGLLFPFFNESDSWKFKGLHWLEQEINYQVYDDGTYLQFSHNYQRVLVQLLSWIVRLSEIHKVTLTPSTKEKVEKVIKYMHHNMIGTEGQMPNYGSNDGALFFKLTDQDYTDFRPQIDALNACLNKHHLYSNKAIQEEANWYGLRELKVSKSPIEEGIKAFESGGIYTIKDNIDQSFTFLKCAKYQDRPAQADNMHLDLWVNGQNYLRDSGTYKYNTDLPITEYFMGSMGHNALMIDNYHQMRKGGRFIWFNWTKEATTTYTSTSEKYTLCAQATMFQELGHNIIHEREVSKNKGQLTWQVHDLIQNLEGEHQLKQYWHPHPELKEKIHLEAKDELGEALKMRVTAGFWSDHYGSKKTVPLWYFETNTRKILTTIKLST